MTEGASRADEQEDVWKPRCLTIELLSDSTFGRGGGTAGEVDVDVDHDETGLPLINGKEIHGLLRDAWLSMSAQFGEPHNTAALSLLGAAGDLLDSAILRIGDALMPPDVRKWSRFAVNRKARPLSADQILRSLTDVRRQTAQSRETGAPETTTLRAIRVVRLGSTFEAPLRWSRAPQPLELGVLAASALAVRHGGLGRNRGKGALRITLDAAAGETNSPERRLARTRELTNRLRDDQ